jgi:hypothetical protein
MADAEVATGTTVKCVACGKTFGPSKKWTEAHRARAFKYFLHTHECRSPTSKRDERDEPDWTRQCENCKSTPVYPRSGLCGPCSFGEADTAHGNW